jgi:hypothetical protein
VSVGGTENSRAVDNEDGWGERGRGRLGQRTGRRSFARPVTKGIAGHPDGLRGRVPRGRSPACADAAGATRSARSARSRLDRFSSANSRRTILPSSFASANRSSSVISTTGLGGGSSGGSVARVTSKFSAGGWHSSLAVLLLTSRASAIRMPGRGNRASAS